MTIIDTPNLDHFAYQRNVIKEAIRNNDPIEEQLHVIAVISNPCLFARRYVLMREFVNRMQKDEPDVILYIVEMVYGDQPFSITNNNNKRHLQLRTQTPLWHKENMINLGVKFLLPVNWRAFAWIDADIEFESASWATDTLKVLNGCQDIVQVFSHCDDMDKEEKTMRMFNSAGSRYTKGYPYCGVGNNFWHPGYAWACTRRAYEKMGGLYQDSILGSGDHNMALALIGQGGRSVHKNVTAGYRKSVADLSQRIKGLRFGYVPGVIRHHFHGSKKNRQYTERWQILVEHKYSPAEHLALDDQGVIIPSPVMPPGLIVDIGKYFAERLEDE